MDIWQQVARRADRISKDLAAQEARACSSSPTYYVPPEILSSIFDNLRTHTSDVDSVFDEKVRTLWAVSLANKECAEIAIPILWENIKIDIASLCQSTYFLRALVISRINRRYVKNVLLHIVPRKLGDWYTQPIINMPDKEQCLDRLIPALTSYGLTIKQENTLQYLLQERLGNKPNGFTYHNLNLHLDLDITLVLLLCRNLHHLQIQIVQDRPSTKHVQLIGALQISDSLFSRLNSVQRHQLPQLESLRHLSIVTKCHGSGQEWKTTVRLQHPPVHTRAIKSATLETVAFTDMVWQIADFGTNIHFLTLRDVVRDGAEFEATIIEHILTVCKTLCSLDISFLPGCRTKGRHYAIQANTSRDYSTTLQHLAVRNWEDHVMPQDDHVIKLERLERLTSLRTLILPIRMLLGRSRSVTAQYLVSALPPSIESLEIYKNEEKSPHLSEFYGAMHLLFRSNNTFAKLNDVTFSMIGKRHRRSWWLSAQELPGRHVGVCNTDIDINGVRVRQSTLKIRPEHAVTWQSGYDFHL